jgi:hypothetical protein
MSVSAVVRIGEARSRRLDPDLTGDPVRPEPAAPPAVVRQPAPAAVAPPATTIRFKPLTPLIDRTSSTGCGSRAGIQPPSPPVSIPSAAPAPTPVPVEPPPVACRGRAAHAIERREGHPRLCAVACVSRGRDTRITGVGTQPSLPSLAEAFATLLSAEQGRPIIGLEG